MAEFGAQATQLSAPQGAGSAPLAPVQEQAVNTSMLPMLAGAAPAIAQGISNIMASKAEAQREQIQKDHMTGIQRFNDLLSTGEIKLNEYAAHVRMHNDQYAAAFPNMSKEFKSNIELANLGRAGPATDQIKTAEEIQTQRIKDMNKMGIDITFNDSPEVRRAAEEKYNSMLRMNAYNDMIVKEAAAFSAKSNIEKERMAVDAHTELSRYAATETDYVYKMAEDIGRKVRSGAMSYEDGKLRIDRIMTQIDLSLNEMAGVNKDSADRFRKTFDQTAKNVYAMIDPKVDLDIQKATNDRAIEAARGRALLRDPRLADTLFQLETMKGAPDIVRNKFATSGGLESFIKMFSNRPVDAKSAGIVPVVGSADDAATVQSMKNIMQAAKATPELNTQAFNLVENYNAQIAQGVAGGDPTRLKQAANFFSDITFGEWYASQGKNVDPQSVANARTVLKRDYESTVKSEIESRIKDAELQLQGMPAAGVLKKSMTDPNSPALTTSRVNPEDPNLQVTFSGGVVRFEMKRAPADAAEARDTKAVLESLRSAEDGLNKIVRLNTHMSRSTDYQADWEANKYNYLPYMFPVKPGTMIEKDGIKYEYVGKGDAFDYRQAGSWRAATKPQ